MNRITGSNAFLTLLKDEGVTHLFGNPGTTELPVMDALRARVPESFRPIWLRSLAARRRRWTLHTDPPGIGHPHVEVPPRRW